MFNCSTSAPRVDPCRSWFSSARRRDGDAPLTVRGMLKGAEEPDICIGADRRGLSDRCIQDKCRDRSTLPPAGAVAARSKTAQTSMAVVANTAAYDLRYLCFVDLSF